VYRIALVLPALLLLFLVTFSAQKQDATQKTSSNAAYAVILVQAGKRTEPGQSYTGISRARHKVVGPRLCHVPRRERQWAKVKLRGT
jgi:hypothetical protein